VRWQLIAFAPGLLSTNAATATRRGGSLGLALQLDRLIRRPGLDDAQKLVERTSTAPFDDPLSIST